MFGIVINRHLNNSGSPRWEHLDRLRVYHVWIVVIHRWFRFRRHRLLFPECQGKHDSEYDCNNYEPDNPVLDYLPLFLAILSFDKILGVAIICDTAYLRCHLNEPAFLFHVVSRIHLLILKFDIIT